MDNCQQACDDCTERLVCRCLRVTEAALRDVLVSLPVRNLKELRQLTGAGDGCTCCHDQLRQLIAEHVYASSASPICSVR
jgi:bacterioferritin-associated ferredoxin